MGMFKGNFGQLAAKWNPYSIKTNVIGNALAHGYNLAGQVDGVTHLEGATALDTKRDNDGAFTVGYYINGPKGFRADWHDHLFVHEMPIETLMRKAMKVGIAHDL